MAEEAKNNRIVIALVGESGSGKSTSAKILSTHAFHLVDLTSRLRAEAVARFSTPSRAQVQLHAQEMQSEGGNAVFAKKTMAGLDFGAVGDIVIDGLRNIEELAFISDRAAQSGRNFSLIALVTPADVRFKRVVERQRHGDPTDRERFDEDDARARGSGTDGFQQNAYLISIADHVIENEGDLTRLSDRIDAVIAATRGK